AVLAEYVTNFAHGAIAVVGIDFGEDGDSARAITFQREFFVGRARQFARAALDRALDIVGGHVFGFSRRDGGAQARSAIRIPAAVLGSNADFLDKTGEDLAALGVQRALLVFNCGTF